VSQILDITHIQIFSKYLRQNVNFFLYYRKLPAIDIRGSEVLLHTVLASTIEEASGQLYATAIFNRVIVSGTI
jgi:hypothetical protein